LAPLLAERFRVLAIDARGHGESDRVDVYSWPSDVRDLGQLMGWIGTPVHLVGHSRGGGQVTDAAAVFPDAVRRVVNIDGFGPPKGGFELIGEDDYVERDPVEEMVEYLDVQGGLAVRPLSWRPRKTFDELVERRAAQNPRLARDWARYFTFHCARETAEGWLWKVDPLTRLGFGPFHPDWIAAGWRGVRAPLLALTGDTADAWGPCDEPTLRERLRFVKDWRRAVVADAGHFVHMEHPAETARVILDFLSG
jgi:pimeloyl-ACP methyl ester carboxylesterase